MSNKCDIIPQIKNKNGEWVDSLLFTSLLENLKDRELAKKAYQQVHSKEFLNWFGDWINNPEEASKVVDENGEPLVVYHGTEQEFDEFNEEYSDGFLGGGIYFTSLKQSAERFAKIGDSMKEMLTAKELMKYVKPVFINSRNPEFISEPEEVTDSGDSVILDNFEEVKVYKANQIKSISSEGFSKESNNIYASQASELSNDMKNVFGDSESTTVKEALEKITKEDNKTTKLLANKLLRYISNDTKIVQSSQEEMQKIKGGKKMPLGGLFNPKTNTIHIRPDQKTSILLHEILHAFTVQQLKSNSQAKKDLDSIYKSLKKSNPELAGEYAMSNLDEFLVGIFTDAKFITKLQNIPSNTNKQLSVWEDLLNVLAEVLAKLGFSKNKAKSILEESMDAAIRVIEDAKSSSDSNLDEAFDTTIFDDSEIYASLAPEEVDYYESQTMTAEQEETMKSILSIQDMGLNKDGSFYVKKENGEDKQGSKLYTRVSDRLDNKFNGDDSAYEINREAGNDVDGILSDVILGKGLSELRDTPRIDEDVRQELFDYFTSVIKDLTADGSIIMTQQIFHNDKSTTAGATDIILVKPDGRLDIYDLKTSTTSTVGDVTKRSKSTGSEYTVNYEKDFRGEKSLKKKHTEQQSMYKRLAELQGFEVDNLHIIPIHIVLKSGKIESVNPEPIIELEYNERLATALLPDDLSEAMDINDLVSAEKKSLELIRERLTKLLAHWKNKEHYGDTSKVLDKLSELKDKMDTITDLEAIEAFIADAVEVVKSFERTMESIKDNPTSKASIIKLGNINSFMDTFEVLVNIQSLMYQGSSEEEQEQIDEWHKARLKAKDDGEEHSFLLQNPYPSTKTALDEAVNKFRFLKEDYLTYGRKAYAHVLFSTIPENVLEETKRIKKIRLKKNKDDAEAQGLITSVQDMERELANLSDDISGWNRWMGSTAGDSNAILALTSLMIKNKLEPVTEQLITDKAELGSILETYLKESGKSRDNVVKLYEDVIETVETNLKDSDGNWTTINQKQFVDKIDWKKYGTAQKELFDNVLKTYKKGSKEYNEILNQWYEDNTKIKSNYKEIMEDRRANLSSYEYAQWAKDNFYKGKPKAGGELVEPSDNFISEKWRKLYDDSGNPISPAGKLHQGMLAKYDEYINLLDYKDRVALTSKGFKLPSVPKSDWERMYNDKEIKGVVKDKFKIVKGKDTNYSDKRLLDVHGKEIKEIPKYYVDEVDGDNVSSDLFESLLMAGKNWRYYKAKSEIQAEVQLVRDLVDSQTVNKSDSLGNAIKDITSKFFKGKAKQTDNSLRDKLNDHLDIIFYGSEDERAEFNIRNTVISGDKLIQNTMFWSSARSLTGNITSGMSNAILGNLTNLIEASAKEYLTPKALAKAHARYTASLGNMALDVNKLTGISLETQLSQLFDFSQAYVESLGKNESGSRLKQMLDGTSLGFVNNAAEHQIYTTAGFAYLGSIKWIDGAFRNRKDYLYGKEGKEREELAKKFDDSKETLLDAYELDSKGIIKLKDKYKLESKERSAFKNTLHEMNKYNHGNYSKHDKVGLQRKWYGKLALFFRKHIQPGIAKRFGKERINYALGGSTKGVYVDAAESGYVFITSMLRDMKDLGFTEAVNRNKLSPSQAANMRRAVAEGGALLITTCLVSMLGGDDDEDKKKSWAQNLLLLQARRLQSELSYYSNPLEFIRLTKSPTVAMGTVEAAVKFGHGMLFEWGEDRYYKRDTGFWEKGDSKSLARFIKLVPGLNSFIALVTPEEQIKFFNKL